MTVTILLEGDEPCRIHVRVSPLAELSAILHAAANVDHHPPPSDDLSPHMTEVRRFAPLYGAFRAQFLLPAGTEEHFESSTLERELDAIEALSVEEFLQQAAEAIAERATGINYASLPSSEASRNRLWRRVQRMAPDRVQLMGALLTAPESFQATFVAFLGTMNRDWFGRHWEDLRPVLAAETRSRRADLRQRGPGALSQISPLAIELHDPHRLVFDKLSHGVTSACRQPVIAMPSFYVSPHMPIKLTPGMPTIVQYPIRRLTTVPIEHVNRRLAALRDTTRIKICRTLAREPSTTMDLAAGLRCSQPQASRHLRALREAGLVLTERRGRLVLYRLDEQAVQRIGIDLLGALYR